MSFVSPRVIAMVVVFLAFDCMNKECSRAICLILYLWFFRIDANFVIKVADFGLSEDIYARNYFRQMKEESGIKLPIRWMALESLQDGIFTEKTDVVGDRFDICPAGQLHLDLFPSGRLV